MPRWAFGFAFLELFLVLLCLGILLAVLGPLVARDTMDSRYARAQAEIKAIRAAVLHFHADVGWWPTRNDAFQNDSVELLYTTDDGKLPVFPPGAYVPVEPLAADALADHLTSNRQGYPGWSGRVGWNGPYWDQDRLDPWGNSYLVYVLGFWQERQDPETDFTEAWILSAGPDGILQTFASDELIALDSDDIGLRLR